MVAAYLADRLGPACEEGIEVQTMGELHNPERRRGSTTPVDLLDFDESSLFALSRIPGKMLLVSLCSYHLVIPGGCIPIDSMRRHNAG
jgi:hypothetical protein